MDLSKNSPNTWVSVSLLLSGYINSFINKYTFVDMLHSTIKSNNIQDIDSLNDNRDRDNDINIKSTLDTVVDCINTSYGIKYMYKSFESAALVLRLYRKLNSNKFDEVNDKISRFYDLIDTIERKPKYTIDLSNRLISIEGLQGCGKTTLINKLLSRSSQYRTIYQPQEVFDVEELFNDACDSVVHAFAVMKNYILIDAIKQEVSDNPSDSYYYLLDTFYHHTCISTIMSQVSNSQDPIIAPAAFDWPTDIPIPKLVIYLSCKTELRLKRIINNKFLTDRSSERTKAKDEKLQTAYSLVRGPATIAIEVNGSALEASNIALEVLTEYGFYDKENIIYDKNTRKQSVASRRMSAGVYSALCNMPEK